MSSENAIDHLPEDLPSEKLPSEKLPEGSSAESEPLILLSGRYQVMSLLGDGGFGQTFLVTDTHMPSHRQCVLKQLKPVKDEPELHQMVQDRFQREAAILEKLGEAHDQIPGLYAYFSEGDQFYLVEEWVEGLTLTQKVHQDGPLSEATVQAILSNLLPVVAYIHNQKIVHRDIKPDNIILRQKDGKPVLIDFGAVKETMKTLINSGGQSTHSIVVGTPGYMPSEQMSGRPIYASDIYSIGMTAIFLLTGKIPQEMEIDPETGALNWRSHAPTVTTGFANFLDCAAHMLPQSRFATVPAMQSVLNTLMMGQMGTQMPSGPTTQPPDRGSNSTQTVISSAPMVNGAPGSSGPMQSGSVHSGPVHSGSQTAIVSPLADFSTAAQGVSQSDTVGYAASPQSTSTAPDHQLRNAVIIGGMVGVSVLVGALVMSGRLPGVMSASSVNEPEQTAVPVETVEPEDKENAPPEDSDEASTKPVAPTQPATPVQSAPAAAPNANGTVVGQGGSKNVRAGSGTGYNVVASVQSGNRIQVVNRGSDSEGYPWYQIVTPSGARGWIAGQLIQIDGDASPPSRATPTPRPTPRPAPTPTPTPVDRTNATITSQESGSKNIRSGPGTNYATQHVAYPGDRVTILDSSKDAGGYTWYKVSFPKSGAQGWIAAQLISRD